MGNVFVILTDILTPLISIKNFIALIFSAENYVWIHLFLDVAMEGAITASDFLLIKRHI